MGPITARLRVGHEALLTHWPRAAGSSPRTASTSPGYDMESRRLATGDRVVELEFPFNNGPVIALSPDGRQLADGRGVSRPEAGKVPGGEARRGRLLV